ncbi:zinc finger, CCHC-type containing protein [Tanacetum coccineum]
MTSPAFVEANYEVLESLLKERRRQKHNEDLRTELEYFSEEYDEEREMEPRPVRNKETTPVLCMRYPRARRQREKMVNFEDIPNRDGGRVERNSKDGMPSRLGADNNGSQGMNLPPLLAAHLGRSENGQPLQSSMTFVHRGPQSSINTGGNLTPNDENPIRTLGDYSKPSHEGYMNTIELPVGNNVVPLRSDTIRLVQNGCSFHGLRSEDPNQHLKDFLKLVDSLDLDGSITTWEDLTTRFFAQFFPPGRTLKLRNDILMFQQHHRESLSEAWTHFKDLLQKVPRHGIDL